MLVRLNEEKSLSNGSGGFFALIAFFNFYYFTDPGDVAYF